MIAKKEEEAKAEKAKKSAEIKEEMSSEGEKKPSERIPGKRMPKWKPGDRKFDEQGRELFEKKLSDLEGL